jgi:hypothetical protein
VEQAFSRLCRHSWQHSSSGEPTHEARRLARSLRRAGVRRFYGLWRGRGSRNVDHYLLAGRTMPWHAMALSIMATQASAVTF